MRRGKFSLAGMILGLIFVQGLTAAAPEKTRQITGRVEDTDGKPVAGAKGWLPGYGTAAKQPASPVVTDADGKLQFDSTMQPQGLVLEAKSGDGTLLGYEQLAWELPMDQPVEAVKLVLREPRELTVEVLDGEKRPVAVANVIAVANYRKVDRTESDASGQAKLRVPADAPLSAVVALKPGVGIPWFVFLDAEGKPLVTSDGPSGNTGYPGEPESREHFEKMLRTEPRHLTDADIESLIAALAK